MLAVQKRKVRRDLADVFCTVEEGIRGQRAVEWRLVDEVVKGSSFEQRVNEKAMEMAANSNRPDAQGIVLAPLPREIGNDELNYAHLKVSIDRGGKTATFMIRGPDSAAPETTDEAVNLGCSWYLLDLVRQLDDAILYMRFNEPAIGTLIFKSTGDREKLLAHDAFMQAHAENWFVREVQLYWKRTLKRIDLTSRTLFTFLEPGSCFAGVLAELIFAADRAYMLEGRFEGDATPPAAIVLTDSNFGPLPMSNGLTRLETRFLGATSY